MSKNWTRRTPRMTTHQKTARMQVRFGGPGLPKFNHSLGKEDLAFARHKAREIDAAQLPSKERKAQAVADKQVVEVEQKNAEVRAQREEERKIEEAKMVGGFTLILNLHEFRLLPASQSTNDFLRRRLVWHQSLGGDKKAPAGKFSNANKAKPKELLVEALERREECVDAKPDIVVVDDTAEWRGFSEAQSLGNYTVFGTTDLLPDESEAELELVDDVGLHPKAVAPLPKSVCGRILTMQTPDPPAATPRVCDYGCIWDPDDYSCFYDCVFTAFAWA